MKWIVISSPSYFDGEDLFFRTLFACGVDIVHLRKPEGNRADTERLLRRLTDEERGRIVTHDCFELAAPYGLKGVHLNRRHPEAPRGHGGSVSRSCHSLDEVRTWKDACDYVFLSPIFDSVSKEGYRSAFSADMLAEASRSGLIDRKVAALGGVVPGVVPYLHRLHFGGAAMLGCVNRLAPLPEEELRARLGEMKAVFAGL